MPTRKPAKRRKSAREKLEAVHPSHGAIEAIPAMWQAKLGSGTMLIPRPLDVDAVMKRVRKGKLVTMGLIRQYLAQAAGASCACPLTTGIFARLAAEAAEEDRSKGKRRITPYWRTIRDDGKLNEKFPGGAAAQAALLEDEGFSITPGSGKQPPRVAEFAKHLMRL